jgi:CBS domain-containing protein
MKVREIMTKTAQTILPDATVEQASQKMRDYNIGLLPVVGKGKILGAVTDRDIVVHAVAEGRNPYLTTVREVMTQKPFSCYEDQSVTEASRIMQQHHVRRLIVIDRRNKLAGILTLTDLALKIPNEKLSGHLLHKVAGAA